MSALSPSEVDAMARAAYAEHGFTEDWDSLLFHIKARWRRGIIAAWNRRAADDELTTLRAELAAARELLANIEQGCGKLATAFRVNMLRHAPKATHAEIDRVIDACMGWPPREALGDAT